MDPLNSLGRSRIMGTTKSSEFMNISWSKILLQVLNDCTSMAYFWRTIFRVRKKENKFLALKLSLKMEIKFKLKDFAIGELYDASFLRRWRNVLPVPSMKLFFNKRQLWLYHVSLFHLKMEKC